jgi:hypothetical protein
MKDNIDKKAVGRRIKQIRINKGCTLEVFGKLDNLNASKSIVLRWENGTSLPNRSRLEIIAKLGNMTVNELLYGDTEKDIEELYQTLIKLPKEDLIILMLKIAENKVEQQHEKR